MWEGGIDDDGMGENHPYKVSEFFKHYSSYDVPVAHQSDPVMYVELKLEVMAKVKVETVHRKEFRVTLKKQKYDWTMEQLENMAYGNIITRL